MTKLLAILLVMVVPAMSLPTQLESTEAVSPFITGGHEVTPNSLPYQAFIEIDFSATSTWCGASIISSNFLLTARHCVHNPPQALTRVVAKLGVHRLDTLDAGTVTQWMPASNVLLHASMDVALIRLFATLTFTARIQPIRLPQAAELNLDYAGYSATASGWGMTDNGYQQALRAVTMNVMTTNGCKQFFWNLDWFYVCMEGNNGRSTCFGDSGGPMVVHNTVGQLTQIGVSAFVSGYGCTIGHPSVYTRITAIAGWIRTNTDAII